MRIFIKAFLFIGIIAFAVPSLAQIHLGINFGPPARRYEVRGRAPSSGSVWISGNYQYNDGRRDYDWVPGRWQEPPSPQHSWVAPRYRRHGDHYDYYEGKWRDNGRHNGRDNNGHNGGNGREK